MIGDDPSRSLVVILSVHAARAVPVRGLGAWLRDVAPARVRGVVSVAVVEDAEIRRLNRRFAGRNEATDVLSFPASGPRGGVPVLGDIVIAAGVARLQAAEAGHPLAEEFKVLALHGLLHLLGYNHHGDGGRMARVEARLRRKGGLRQGLIQRAGRP